MVKILCILLLISASYIVSQYDAFIAGIIVTFPIVTISSIILNGNNLANTKRLIHGAEAGVMPLLVLLIAYLKINERLKMWPSLFISCMAWALASGIEIIFFHWIRRIK